MADKDFGHTCYHCRKEITGGEPHIHVGLDEWTAYMGLDGQFGLDDLLTFPFCGACTEQVPHETPWRSHAHEIKGA